MAAALLPKDFDLSTLTTSAALFSPSSTPATTTTPGQQSTPAPQPPSSPNHSTAPAPSYTLPQIRAIHGALHARVADLSAALRTRVGASYRELLGTADTIVAMRRDMDDRVLATLGGMGGRCGGGVVGAKVQGLRAFAAGDQYHGYGCLDSELGAGEGRVRMGDVARGRLLEAVLLCLGGVLRSRREEGRGRGEGLMVAARLYVLGRLLVQSFGEGAGGAGGMEKKVAAARKSLETVHQARLARSIDAVLRSGSHKAMRQGDVLRALGAYSLATSSGARDVLAHFLRVRAKAIAMALHVDEEDEEDRVVRNPQDVLRALGLYTKTLQDVQALVPHELTEALVALKEERLLENASLKEMEGLRLDIYRRWCGDEIQFYTPFIRHDDLDGKQAREMLASWAEKGSEVLLQGLEKTLEGMAEFKAVVDLRTSVLKLWIAEGGKARGFDPSIMLNQLRDVINKHMLRVLEAKVAKLRLVGSEVSATLDAWREGVTDRHPSLWDVASFDTDLSNGSTLFTQDVVARLHGRNDAVSRAVTSFKSWFHVIDDVGQVVDQLRRQRWDNDVDEIEDEETIEERQKLLSKDDPRALSEHLNRLLVEAFRRLDDQLTTLWKVQQGGPNNGVVAMYFLRLLRDMRARLPELEAVKGFGLSAVPSLHEAVAAVVVLQPLDELASVALARKTVVGRSLWEGDPELPSSPSPGAFKFLRNLTVAMGDAGGDLWSPAAVAVLKRHLTKQISAAWLEALGALGGPQDGENKNAEGAQTEEEGSKEEGTSVNATASTGHQDLLIQWLLDIYYLGLFLGSDEDSFKELEEAVYPRSGLEPSAKERLNKAARDYFKRTRLLFGLLA